jgi:hypothetical protein
VTRWIDAMIGTVISDTRKGAMLRDGVVHKTWKDIRTKVYPLRDWRKYRSDEGWY